MRRGNMLFDRLADQITDQVGTVPGLPLAEIAGDRRVLIENHQGVTAYGKERIAVKVPFGFLCVSGCQLELMHMSREQLVICGRIDAVTLQRR